MNNNLEDNKQFDKFKNDEDDIDTNNKGYGDWLKSNEDIVDMKNISKSNMMTEFEKHKKQIQTITKYEGVNDMFSSTFGATILGEQNNFTSGGLFNEDLGFTDLRQAYQESVIPITEDDYNNIPKYKNIKISTNPINKKKLIITINENKSKIVISEGFLDTLKNIGSKVRDFLSLSDVFTKLNLAPYFSAIKQGYDYVKSNPNEVKKNVEILMNNEPNKLVKEAIDVASMIGPTFIKTMALTSLGMYAYHVMKVVSFMSGQEGDALDVKDSLQSLMNTNPIELIRKASQVIRMTDQQLQDRNQKINALDTAKQLLELSADIIMT
jgi:hypothetical protein